MSHYGFSPPARRLVVRAHRWGLDHRLADGCSAAASDELGLRAQQLVGANTRRSLACSLRDLVAKAEKRSVAAWSPVPICRDAVVPWREAILGLAEWLEQPRPVNPRGVARVAVLLTDGTSAFYNPAAERSISEAVWWVADGLQPSDRTQLVR
jgi:hypothetical protein